MYTYSMHQWILFFYFYCFCGWIWESCYVSAKKRHWINRGFLHGPLLPIYGSGAIIVLLATIPVKDNLVHVFFMGMIAATALEYITGYVMELMFHVRYWDYSNQKLNLNGYICVSSSLAWGVFSIGMIRFVHPPVAQLFSMIPDLVNELMAYAITIAFTIDSVASFNEAMDLRELLSTITESNEDIRRIRMRMDVYAAFAGDSINEGINDLKERASAARLVLEGAAGRKLTRRQIVNQNIESRRESRLDNLRSLTDALSSYQETLRKLMDTPKEGMENVSSEISDSIQRLSKQIAKLSGGSNKSYKRAIDLLKRNPGAKSDKYLEALKDIKDLEK